MNIRKIFIFNVCILMGFQNISAMQKTEENLCAEKLDSSSPLNELWQEIDEEEKKEVRREINLIKEYLKIKLNDTRIEPVKKDIKRKKNRLKFIDQISLQSAEDNLKQGRSESQEIKSHRKKNYRLKEELEIELAQRNKRKKDLESELKKLEESNLENLDLEQLNELKGLYKELQEKFKKQKIGNVPSLQNVKNLGVSENLIENNIQKNSQTWKIQFTSNGSFYTMPSFFQGAACMITCLIRKMFFIFKQ